MMMEGKKIQIENIKKNKSSYFILPMLGWQVADLSEKFINCYIGDIDKPEYDDKILLLFKYSGILKDLDFEKLLFSHPYFIDTYDPNKGLVMYVFNIGELLKEDMDKFKSGKYSKLSNELKSIICKGRQSNEKIVKACYPTQFDRNALKRELENSLNMKIDLPEDAEILSIPNMERELFNKNIII